MKVKFLKLKNWLLVTLMGAMGFSSCHCHKQLAVSEPEPDSLPIPEQPQVPDDRPEDRSEIRLMYGVPTMNFMIRGQVRDAKGRPVRNIHVNMLERNMELEGTALQGDPEAIKAWLDGTAIETDGDGRFEIQRSGTPQELVRLMVRDVDGKVNGDFKDKVVEMEVTPADLDRSEANGWFQGTFNKEVDIKLERK